VVVLDVVDGDTLANEEASKVNKKLESRIHMRFYDPSRFDSVGEAMVDGIDQLTSELLVGL